MPRRFVEHNVGFGSLNVIPHHVTIMGKCEACGRMVEMDRDVLEKNAGKNAWLETAEKRLKCQECGAKAGKIVTGYYPLEGWE